MQAIIIVSAGARYLIHINLDSYGKYSHSILKENKLIKKRAITYRREILLNMFFLHAASHILKIVDLAQLKFSGVN